MSRYTLVYCFSKKLAFSEERYTTSLNLLKKSVQLSSKLYPVKVYTDDITAEDLSLLDVDVINLGILDLIFVDDFKVHLLGLLEENELFVDSDVLIHRELTLDFTKDLIFDFIDSPNSFWYNESFEKLNTTSIKSHLDSIGKVNIVPNLGFLKITNSTLLREYKKQYLKLRSLLLAEAIEIKPVGQFSMVLGQYLLGIVLNQDNYSYFSIGTHNDDSTYKHLSGPVKFQKKQ